MLNFPDPNQLAEAILSSLQALSGRLDRFSTIGPLPSPGPLSNPQHIKTLHNDCGELRRRLSQAPRRTPSETLAATIFADSMPGFHLTILAAIY